MSEEWDKAVIEMGYIYSRSQLWLAKDFLQEIGLADVSKVHPTYVVVKGCPWNDRPLRRAG